VYTYTAVGTYDASVTVTDGDGATSTETVTVNVTERLYDVVVNVTDNSTGDPIQGASVSVLDGLSSTTDTLTTDSNGESQFSVKGDEQVSVDISATGYTTSTTSTTFPADGNSYNISLEPEPTETTTEEAVIGGDGGGSGDGGLSLFWQILFSLIFVGIPVIGMYTIYRYVRDKGSELQIIQDIQKGGEKR